MAVVWLVLLPAAGRRDALRRAIDSRERRGIDASAMFYTELEVMDDVLERSREFHRRSPEALWRCQW